MRMKWILPALVACSMFAAGRATGEPVSPEKARTAVETWLARGKKPLGARFRGSGVEAVRSFSDDNGRYLFHCVAMQGGGFVVTSGDTEITPIIAFSDSGTFDASEDNPLYLILKCDMANRLAIVSGTAIQKTIKKPVLAETGNRPEATWMALTKEDGDNCGKSVPKASASSLEDLRVAPLVQSKWNQHGWKLGSYVYNCYTPSNVNCGCTATAVSQVMRYWTFPTNRLNQTTYQCKFNGSTTNLTTFGGPYDWGNMPLTLESITNVEQCKAIGELVYDVAVVSEMSWVKTNANSYGAGGGGFPEATRGLVDYFGYSSAIIESHGGKTGNLETMSDYRASILGSVNAGMPTVIAIKDTPDGITPDAAHAVVLDGYGYLGGTMFCHVNFGYGGSYDTWYNLFDETIEISDAIYKYLYLVIANIHPSKKGWILSGRVQDRNGDAVPGASVRVKTPKGGSLASTSDARGIWHAWTTESGTFAVSASKDTLSEKDVVEVNRSSGNIWNADVTLVSSDELPNLGFAPKSGWTDAVFLASSTNATTGEFRFAEGKPVYLYCGFENRGASAISHDYVITHEVLDLQGNVLKQTPCECTSSLWLEPGHYRTWSGVDFAVPTNLPAGRYTYRCVLDSGRDIRESNEDDNEFSLVFDIGLSMQTAVFKGNEGMPAAQTNTYAVGGRYNPLPTATRADHAFAGWWTAADGGEQVTTNSVVTADLSRTFYAHWTSVGKPNLCDWTPTAFGWPQAVYLANSEGSTNAVDSFLAGETVYLNFALRNAGKSDAGSFRVSAGIRNADNGAMVTNWSFAYTGLAHGYGIRVTNLAFKAETAGGYQAFIQLDSGEAVSESDETDNTLSLDFTVEEPGKPNLCEWTPTAYGWPSALYLAKAAGSTNATESFSPDETIYLNFALRNAGKSDAGPYQVTAGIRNASSGEVVANWSAVYSGVPVGYGVRITNLAFRVETAGEYCAFAILDSAGDISESNEHDNSLERIFTVTAGSGTDLRVAGCIMDEERPGWLRIQWFGEEGRRYAVTQTPTLDGSNILWTNAASMVAEEAGLLWLDVPMSGNSGFFRLEEK